MSATPGQIIDILLRSRALLKTMPVRVYLPPYYDDYSMHYPVVYLLHPWESDHTFWTDQLGLHTLADHLVHTGTIPPFIAVMPQGDKSFFINAEDPGGDFSMVLRLDPDHFEGALEGYGDYGDYLIQDVITNIEKVYRVRGERNCRVIAGIGMGATGAAVQALSVSDRFGAVGIHSPTLFTTHRLGPPWIFGLGDAAAFAPRDPITLARKLDSSTDLAIYLDCGLDDDRLDLAGALHDALSDRGVPHTYINRPGHYDVSYWQAQLAEYLGFYAARW